MVDGQKGRRAKNRKFPFFDNKEEFHFEKKLMFLFAIKFCVFTIFFQMKKQSLEYSILKLAFFEEKYSFCLFFRQIFINKNYRIYFFVSNFGGFYIKIIFF
jgi:hypothetical protein